MACNDRQLTQAQREAGFEQMRTAGVVRAPRPFSGQATPENLVDYLNREVYPALKAARDKVNDVYRQVTDNAPSANPLAYYFSTETAAADPTTGRLRLDNATQNLATTIRISQTNARLADAGAWLDIMSGAATFPLGSVAILDAIDPSRFLRFDLNTMVDQGAYWDLGVVIVESSHDNPFVDGGAVIMSFIPGVAAAGATVPSAGLAPIAANSVLANATGATAVPVGVPVGTNTVLGRQGGDIVAAQVATAQVADDAVTNTKLANMAAATVKGRALGAGTGDPTDLTAEELVEILSTAEWALAIESGAGPFDDYPVSNTRPIHLVATNAAGVFTGVDGALVTGQLMMITHIGAGYTELRHNTTSATGDRFYLGNTGQNLRLTNDESAFFISGDIDPGVSPSLRWILISPQLPFATASTAVTGDIVAFTGSKMATVSGGNSADVVLRGNATFGTVSNAALAPWTFAEESGAGPFDDYNPGGGAPIHLMATNAAGVFTGVLGGSTTGNRLLVTHIGSGYTELQHNVTSGAGARFYNGATAKNLRLFNGQAAFYIAADITSGAGTSMRWHLVSPLFPFANASDAVAGDIVAHNGTSMVALSGGNSADVVLRGNATFGTVSNAALRTSAALSVIGRSANSTGAVADISAVAASGAVLRESGSTIGFGTVSLAGLTTIAQSRILGRAEGAGTGAVTELTPTQVVAVIDGEAATWTGNHTFSGNTFDVNVALAASMVSVSDMGIGSTGGGLSLGAGAVGTHIFQSPNVDNGDVVINAAGGVAVTAGMVTGSSGTTTGAVNITASAASTITTTSGNLTLSTSNTGTRVVVSGADDVLIEAVADDIFINSGDLTAITAGGSFRVTTGATQRYQVTSAGAHTIDGTTLVATLSGETTWAGSFLFNQRCRFNALLSTSIVAVQVNNLDVSTVNVVRVTPSGAATLTGMVAGADGQVVIMINTSSTGSLTLIDEGHSTLGTASAAANRFQLFGATTQTLSNRAMVIWWYDGTTDRWRANF